MISKTYMPVFSEEFSVRSFDISVNHSIRMSSLCGYLQEVAGKHATHLDVGYKFVHEAGMVWVLSKIYMQINQLPKWGETFTVDSWPLGNERIFYRRDYCVSNHAGIQVEATSYWILLDIQTRRPKVIPIHAEVINKNKGKFAMQMPKSIPAVTSGVDRLYNVRYSDLDQNKHVNNARYVEWIFDSIEPSRLEKSTPSFFAIEYKQEVKAGDKVMISTELTDPETSTYVIEGRLSPANQTCFRSKVVF